MASVIVPAWNAERHLREAVTSALNQTHHTLEVIVVNDGSTDGTAALAEQLAREDSRVRVVHQDNAGVGAARNRGIAEARGEFVAPLDADDFWYPEKLSLQIRSLEEKGGRWGFSYCWSRSVNEHGEITDPLPHWPVEGRVFEALIYRNIIGNASVPLFRTSAVREAGGYRTRESQGGAQGCEDWDLTIRVAERWLAASVPEYLVAYRQVPGTMTENYAGMQQSYESVIARVRENHPELPASLFRWSAGHFYLYLLNTCHAAGAVRPCFSLLRRLLAADPAVLLSPTIYRVAAVNVLRLAFGPQFLRRRDRKKLPPEAGRALWMPAHWVEARRWARLLANRPAP